MIPLTGLTALRITKFLAQNRMFVISHFNKPLAMVISYNEQLLNSEYIIMKKPTTKRELYKLCNQLENELNNEKETTQEKIA